MKKNDKLFKLGITALKEFYDIIHENVEICINLFAIDELRENYYDILNTIKNN